MQNPSFRLCDDTEEIVKKYECTVIHKIFNGKTTGDLYVTNKRVVYYSEGKSLLGKSRFLNEMPIDDVLGMNFYMGSGFNILGSFILAVLGVVFGSAFVSLLPYTLFKFEWGVLFCLPFIIVYAWQNEIIHQSLKIRIYKVTGVDKEELNHILRSKVFEFVIKGLLIFGGVILTYSMTNNLVIVFFIYLIIAFLLVGKAQVFSFGLYSKTSSGTAFYLPGKLVNIKDTTALDTLRTSPSKDAEILILELGALIMDINQYGEIAIEKWKGKVAL